MNRLFPSLKRFFTTLARRAWRRRRWFAAGFSVSILLLALLLAWPMDREAYLHPPASGEMLDRSGRLVHAFLSDRQQWCFRRELREISPLLIKATLATEDQRFRLHPGIDPLAVLRAAWGNLTRRRVVSGASTLTMQVVKQGSGDSSSLMGKARQALGALRLELRASKDEILTAYLNGAPYGLNLIGCEAAARRFFGKPASELSLAEAALLAGLPKAPTSLMPIYHPHAAFKRRNHVLRRMFEERMISGDDFKRASAEPVTAAWHGFPTLAPHLAMRLRTLAGSSGRLTTTLDRDVQAMAEEAAREHVRRYRGQIGNAAVVVLDAPSAAVLAHVGSADFFNRAEGGQVDVTRCGRSPGSALKPFTYALAMERDRLYPCETLLDDRADYGLFNPENMDRHYHGLVTAEAALRRSLNVPAILILERLGVDSLYQFLRELHFTTLRKPAEHYGLGLTLGSCEVRLEELAAAYAMLANLGQFRPLRFLASQPERPACPVLQRGTCLKIYESLEQAFPREIYDAGGQAVSVTPRVCWKTGTSWGHHDAWTVAFNRQYVVAVWMGNNNAKPSPMLIGARSALPLAGRIFRALPPSSAPAWPSPGDELHEVRVCATSGLPASDWCLRTRAERLSRTQLLNRLCDMHYPAQTTDTLNPIREDQVAERWPATAKEWDLANITRVLAPRPGDSGRHSGFSITAPVDKAEYVLTGVPEGDRLRLASSADQQTTLYWYLNDQFLGEAAPWNPLTLNLTPGHHKLVCMTPQGLCDQVRFEVIDPTADLHQPIIEQGQ